MRKSALKSITILFFSYSIFAVSIAVLCGRHKKNTSACFDTLSISFSTNTISHTPCIKGYTSENGFPA